MTEPLSALITRPQWILVRLVPKPDGKTDKFPIDHRTLRVFEKGTDWQNDPVAWTDYNTTRFLADQCGDGYGVGFLFTPNDPLFFLDIDDCLTDTGWSATALTVLTALPGAAVEVSQSGKGLHVFGSYSGLPPAHGCKNIALGLELYTESRFAMITGDRATGDARTDCTDRLRSVIDQWFPPSAGPSTPTTWTTEPVPEYTGPADDQELINRMLSSKQTAGAAFGGRASVTDLWNANTDALAIAYPDPGGTRAYDASSADRALAQHLAFWTGRNAERIRRLMDGSALRRDKWDREDYLIRTITGAVAAQTTVYSVPGPAAPTDEPAALRGTQKQVTWALQIKANKLAEYPAGAEIFETIDDASWWVNNREKTGEQLAGMLTPIESPTTRPTDGPAFTVGHQILGPEQQIEHFHGCVYVQDQHRVFVPSGALLKPDQFNSTFGGYEFTISSNGKKKPTTKAWEAFNESQLVKYPLAESTCFKPTIMPGEIVNRDGQALVNVYTPVITGRKRGDATPFFDLLLRILPHVDDRAIALAYLAAIVQHKGVKFQWAPLFQGVEGNGKTFLTRCVAAAIGDKYFHSPRADEIGEKYNDWLFNKILIGVEDIYIIEQKRELIEILKPMITSERYVCRAMQASQIMRDLCCNFIFNSNHKDAVRKTENDRRLAVFYTAQQKKSDIDRDGMGGSYFPDLYNWARAGGDEIIHDVLMTHSIPDALNPAGDMHRAPRTSSTIEAVAASLGGVEQQILEAVDEGKPGFAGGWISSSALDALLRSMRRDNSIPINKRRELLNDLGYDYHPALRGGRVNNPVLPDGGKPRLFVKRGHLACNITVPAEVAAAYSKAQGAVVGGTNAAAVFGANR